MPLWRDEWDGPPNVVVIAETPVTEQGTVEDALLFVLDECEDSHLTLTDKAGQEIVVELPSEALEGSFFIAGTDLATFQENP